ncbi:hypothetical protein EB796_008919 [Bugula neritina]|uniref:Uncharacterized protein n=1 Tax=Bugula neritina TaxID=10212 RepID=A0A7J7K2B3_BUGNE|nr:hypothetical protein EB796_008919 [Bugula neritina]
MVKARKLVYSRKHDYTCIYELSHRPISKVEAQVLPDNNGVKRHYSTGICSTRKEICSPEGPSPKVSISQCTECSRLTRSATVLG